MNIVEHTEALEDLDSSMKENIKFMKANIENIRQRFKKIKKK